MRLTLQAHGRRRAAPRRGAHRRKRPRRALPGMMLHQDGSRHAWVPGRWWDLIVTMDDATSTIYSAFFVDEESTMSSLRALSEVIAAEGLFGSLYADRASHYWHTPEAGGTVDKDKATQVGRAWPDTTPMASPSNPKPGRPREPLRRSLPKPCGEVDSRSAPDHFSTGPTTTTEAVNSFGT